MRIAIVDDDPIVCQSLETILTATGTADVLWTANDGGAAVQQYFASPANHPDILLIDIQMPGKDGLDAAREILPKDPAARILFLTTFADKDYIAQAMALGAKGYLIKQDVAAGGHGRSGGARCGNPRQTHRTDYESCRFQQFRKCQRFRHQTSERPRT